MKLDKLSPMSLNDLGLFNKSIKNNNTSFSQFLVDAVGNVNKLQHDSEAYSMKLASGELENIHEAMIASQKAEVSMQFMLEIRSKVMDAYQEIMRMQI
ncbi:MAG: flagellar hook-basal body complex protein FliE [Clostridiaceae bacterium]|nr:flagellar hook-basal body complex protein FliE [Clostridiaceae bacterium]